MFNTYVRNWPVVCWSSLLLHLPLEEENIDDNNKIMAENMGYLRFM